MRAPPSATPSGGASSRLTSTGSRLLVRESSTTSSPDGFWSATRTSSAEETITGTSGCSPGSRPDRSTYASMSFGVRRAICERGPWSRTVTCGGDFGEGRTTTSFGSRLRSSMSTFSERATTGFWAVATYSHITRAMPPERMR